MPRAIPIRIAWLLLAASACSTGTSADAPRSDTTRIGDTLVVTTRGEDVRDRIDRVDVLWQSTELENPRALLALSDRLIVADPTRIHILSASGERVRTVGREGAGPGEFRSIAMLGRAGRDTIAVHDVANQRIALLTLDGELLREARAAPRVPFVNPVEGTSLLVRGASAISFWEENVGADVPTRTALLWRDLDVDTIAVLEVWDGPTWIRLGDLVVTVPLFGPQALVALAHDGTIAAGNGVDHCITIHAPGVGGIRKVCRDRAAIPVGAAIRDPDLSRVDSDSRRQALMAVMREQPIAEHLPSFDRVLFDERGRLWVRTLARELADVHPYLRRYYPEREPTHRAWDVFDESGRLVRTVELPSTFTPQAITANEILGFTELETGEIAIGRAEISF